MTGASSAPPLGFHLSGHLPTIAPSGAACPSIWLRCVTFLFQNQEEGVKLSRALPESLSRCSAATARRRQRERMVGGEGFEPPTLSV